MASKVNTKFVVLLAVGLVAVFGAVAGVALMVLTKSGENYEQMGDRAAAEGDWVAAAKHYGRAVGHEKTNRAWLEKWRDAVAQTLPETFNTYQNEYQQTYVPILSTLAFTQRTDVGLHRAFISELHTQIVRGGGSRDGWEWFIGQVENSLRNFDGQPAGDWEVLKRFRGMARSAMASIGLEVKPDQRKQAEADLTRALEVDPADYESAIALARLQRSAVAALTLDTERDQRLAVLQQSQATIDEFIAKNPNAMEARIAAMGMQVQTALDAIDLRQPAERVMQQRRDAVAASASKVKELIADIAALPPEKLHPLLLGDLRSLASAIDRAGTQDGLRDLIERALSASPKDPDLLALRADEYIIRGELDKALEVFAQIRALPMVPLSLKGLILYERQREAILGQASIALSAWEAARDPEERRTYLQRAKQYRGELVQQIAETQPPVMLLDAKIARAEGNFQDARRLLDRYNDLTKSSNPEALALLGDTAMRLNQPGVARSQFQRLLDLQPSNTQAMAMLAGVEAQLQNLPRALELYERVLQVDPSNADVRRQVQTIRAMQGEGTASDPIDQALIAYNVTARGTRQQLGDPQAAEAELRKAFEANNFHPRIADTLARVRLGAGDREGALAVLDQSLAKHPDQAQLNRLRTAMQSSDPLEMELAWIRESDAPEIEKLIAIFQALSRAGKTEEAAKALDDAAKNSPEDARVIELTFVRALGEKKLDEAQRIVDLVTTKNLDRSNGLLYRARLQAAQGNLNQARSTMQQALDGGVGSVDALRLMAAIQIELGRTNEAIETLRRALQARPDDLQAIFPLMQQLDRAGRSPEALELARASEPFGRGNDQFLDYWLDLEARAGNRPFAIQRREQIATRTPQNKGNRFALAALYIQVGRFPDARRLIDELRTTDDNLALVRLDARWHALQGNLDQARQVFVKYINDQTVANTITAEPYLAFGVFMIEQGQPDVGLAAMEQARRFQPADSMPADRMLGDTLFSLGRYQQARDAYQRVIDAKPANAPLVDVAKRQIEVYLRLRDWAQAEKLLGELPAAADNELAVVLLRSEAARGAGNMQRAREFLDRGVQRFPDNPLAYLRRAQVLMTDPRLRIDAMDDLNAAVRLQPNNWLALRTRAQLNFESGRIDAAMNDLGAAVAAHPDPGQLRVGYMEELMKRDRESDAVDVADKAIEARPNDVALILEMGDVFSRTDRWPRAMRYYARAWALNKDAGVTTRYVGSLLRQTPADLRQAETILNDPASKTNENSLLLLQRAEVRMRQNQLEPARRDVDSSYALVPRDMVNMSGWLSELERVFTKAPDLLNYLAALERADRSAWPSILRARVLAKSPETRKDAIQILTGLQQNIRATDMKVISSRLLSLAYYEEGEFQKAADSLRVGLEASPNDLEMSNNLAFILVKHLGKAEEALPFAQKAVEMAPESPSVLDTLGVAYLRLGKLEQAIEFLNRGYQATSNDQPRDRVQLGIHLAEARLATNDKGSAIRLAEEARELLNKHADLPDDLRQEHKSLMERITTAR